MTTAVTKTWMATVAQAMTELAFRPIIALSGLEERTEHRLEVHSERHPSCQCDSRLDHRPHSSLSFIPNRKSRVGSIPVDPVKITQVTLARPAPGLKRPASNAPSSTT